MSELIVTEGFGLIDHIRALDVGDPYGIQTEYLAQSPNPDAAKAEDVQHED